MNAPTTAPLTDARLTKEEESVVASLRENFPQAASIIDSLTARLAALEKPVDDAEVAETIEWLTDDPPNSSEAETALRVIEWLARERSDLVADVARVRKLAAEDSTAEMNKRVTADLALAEMTRERDDARGDSYRESALKRDALERLGARIELEKTARMELADAHKGGEVLAAKLATAIAERDTARLEGWEDAAKEIDMMRDEFRNSLMQFTMERAAKRIRALKPESQP